MFFISVFAMIPGKGEHHIEFWDQQRLLNQIKFIFGDAFKWIESGISIL